MHLLSTFLLDRKQKSLLANSHITHVWCGRVEKAWILESICLDRNPISATYKVCDLGQATHSLRAVVISYVK